MPFKELTKEMGKLLPVMQNTLAVGALMHLIGLDLEVLRGVNFDVGHGAGSFNWQVARAGLEQGLLPTTISSDIHAWNIAGPVYDLATTASKFLHLGLSLPEVVRRVTATPAACIGRANELGTLAPGATADISLFRLQQGEFPLQDSAGQVEFGGTRLEPVAVIRTGRYYACSPTRPLLA